jgi:hypothetical protein
MDSFGLGLILNFTDNATAGIGRASKAFNEMSGLADKMVSSIDSSISAIQGITVAGYGLSIVGGQMIDIGNSIKEVFMGALNTITKTGTEIYGTRITLSTLFKSAEEGEKAFNWAKDFAKTSVFNFKDLLPAMTMMKAVGIDVRDTITTTSGMSQNLLEYAGDLAAVFPNMRNLYGTGIQAAMGALKEYISEGNAISLKRGAGLDIEEIIGESKGGTAEERSRQVADLIEKIGALGMVANLAGTPMQRLSNIQDLWFNMLTEISDRGVFEKYTQLVEKFTDYIFNIPASEMSSIAQVISDALVSLMSPFERLIDLGIKLVDWLRETVREHPGLVKILVTLTALVGVFLVVSGSILKFAGGLLVLAGSMSSIMLNMALLGTKGLTFATIFKGAISMILTKLIPFMLVASALYYIWKENLFGIRDLVVSVFKRIYDTITIMSDAWDFTLSEENFTKARDMGILPLIEALLDFKFIAGTVWEGFKEGLKEFSDWAVSAGEKVQEFFDSILDVIQQSTGISLVFPDISNGLTSETIDNWKEFGRVIGIIGGLFVTWKIAETVFGISKAVLSLAFSMGKLMVQVLLAIVKYPIMLALKAKDIAQTIILTGLYVKDAIVRGVSIAMTWLQVAAQTALNVVQTIWNALLLLNPLTWIIIAIVAVIAIIVILWNKSEAFRNFVIGMWDAIVNAVKTAGLWIYEHASNAVAKVKEIWNTVKDFIGGIFDKVKDKAKAFFDWILSKFGWLIDIAKGIKNAFTEGAEAQAKARENGMGRQSYIGGATGGYVKSEGLMVLHPDELIVNDRLTQLLGGFLGDYQTMKTNSIPSSSRGSELAETTKKSIVQKPSVISQDSGGNDYRTIFESGSVVIQVMSSVDSELEKIAEKLMKIIARKQQLRAMAMRQQTV